MLVTVRGTTFTLVDVRLSRVFSRKLPICSKIDFEKTRALKVLFEFPPTLTWNFFIFMYVVANILLYLKRQGSAQTVELSRRTSSQCKTFGWEGQNLVANLIHTYRSSPFAYRLSMDIDEHEQYLWAWAIFMSMDIVDEDTVTINEINNDIICDT